MPVQIVQKCKQEEAWACQPIKFNWPVRGWYQTWSVWWIARLVLDFLAVACGSTGIKLFSLRSCSCWGSNQPIEGERKLFQHEGRKLRMLN